MKRITVSLSADLVHHLTYCAERMGVSRSAFLDEMMAVPMGDMYKLLKTVPEDPSKLDKSSVRRSRGESKAVVEARMDGLKEIANDLLTRLDTDD